MKKQYDELYVLVLELKEDAVRTSGQYDEKNGDTMYDYEKIFYS